MAISNYTELQSFLSQWEHRGDLATIMPDIIRLGESYLNRQIRTKSQDVVADLTCSTSSRSVALPDRVLELCDLAIVIDGTQQRLQQVGTESFYALINENKGVPSAYAVRDGIELDCIPDQAYTLKCHYYKSLDIATDLTNYVLTNYPDAYLSACMAAIKMYLKADPTMYFTLMDQVIKTINSQESRSKSTTLITDVAVSGGFNINRGY